MIRVIYPERISLTDWADNLLADYYFEDLPKLQDENKWQEWAAKVAGTGSFLAASVPSPISKDTDIKFKKWEDWAKSVYLIMSNEYNK